MSVSLAFSALIISLFFGNALADAIADFSNLQSQCIGVSDQLFSSVSTVNGTQKNAGVTISTPYDTAGALATLTGDLQTSESNYENNQAAFVNGKSMDTLNNAYLLFVNEILTLSNALITRGQAPHTEADIPVWDRINTYARALHDYARGLTAQNLISQAATIRSITAENSLDDAQTAWGRAAATST